MAIGYKYAERNADSQVNWAEVGKGLSDMLAETNRVRQEKKDALDTAQRETMNYLAETPNGEHVGARESILEYANMSSNQMRVMKQLMEQGQLDVKDYTIFRQNLTDNTNLAFNANKLYQEKYSDVMKGVADKKYSQLYADNFAEVEGFGDWRNIGWQIAPNGVVMAGKMVEEEVDGKKVRTLDKTPGALRSMDYLNQSLVSQVDFYNYEDKVNSWVETLGKEKTITEIDLGGIQRKGKITTKEDITSREDLSPGTKDVLYTFLQGENDQIASIVGDPLDASRVLVDSAIFAPNGQQYGTTTSEEEAKKNPNLILKVVNPDTGGFKYVISKQQQEDANEFVRGQMRSKYNYEESAEAVGATQRDEPRPPTQIEVDRQDEEAAAKEFARQLSKLTVGNETDANNSLPYFQSLIEEQGGKINRTTKGIEVITANGDKKFYTYTAGGKVQNPLELQRQLVTALNTRGLNDDMIGRELKKFYNPKQKINQTTVGTGYVPEVDYRPQLKKTINSIITPKKFFNQNSRDAAPAIKKVLASIPTLSVVDKGNYTSLSPVDRNKIEIKIGKNAPITISSKSENPEEDIQAIYDYIESTLSKAEAEKFLQSASKKLPAKPKTAPAKKTTIQGGTTR
jgi:hypothetical protein